MWLTLGRYFLLAAIFTRKGYGASYDKTMSPGATVQNPVDKIKKLAEEQSKLKSWKKKMQKEVKLQDHKIEKMEAYINETSDQFSMYVQYHKRFDRKLGMPFNEVVRIASSSHKVYKEIEKLAALEYKYRLFSAKYASNWNVSYSEVVRLTENIDFKVNESVPILEKIDYMYKTFKRFKRTWNITFPSIIKLTESIKFQVNGSISTLEAINYMYKTFIKKYQKEWDVEFQDVWRLATDIKIEINQSVPILEKLDYMYNVYTKNHTCKNRWGINFKLLFELKQQVDFNVNDSLPIIDEFEDLFQGFEEIWGRGSFKDLLTVVKSVDKEKRKSVFEQINGIKVNGSIVKFTPAKFSFRAGKLIVEGPMYVYYYKRWNMVYGLNENGGRYSSKEADAICRAGKYKRGTIIEYGQRKSSYGDQYWLSSMNCYYGEHQSMSQCNPQFQSHEGLDVRCYF